MRSLFAISWLLIFFSSAEAQEFQFDHCNCFEGGIPSDSTFTFRGRLSLWNGNPAFRIWPAGSKRLLGIRGVCVSALELGTWNPYHDHELWADFTVSAVTPQEPGVMQFVCIRSMKAPFLRKKPD